MRIGATEWVDLICQENIFLVNIQRDTVSNLSGSIYNNNDRSANHTDSVLNMYHIGL